VDLVVGFLVEFVLDLGYTTVYIYKGLL